MRFFSFIILCAFSVISTAQTNSIYKVSYDAPNKENAYQMYYHHQMVYLSDSAESIQQFTDLNKEENISSIQEAERTYHLVTPFDSLPQATITRNAKTIMGYRCNYAKYNYFSNNVEVWFTENTKAKGSPYSRFLPNKNALVLEIKVNGSLRLTANAIKKVKTLAAQQISKEAIIVNKAVFEELKINSRYTRLSVFKEQIINFEPELKATADTLSNVVYRFSKGTVVMKKIKLSKALRESGHVFARLHCRSNGDAYDRTGSVFLLNTSDPLQERMLAAYQFGIDTLPVYTDKKGAEYQGVLSTESYAPAIELMRFFTSFGADHFNNKRPINNYPWAEDVLFEQEVSALIPNDEAELWIGVFIGNYDKGGHIISLDLDFHPAFNPEEEIKSKHIQPLFSTINTLEMSGQNYGRLFGTDTLRVPFELTENVRDLQLLFTTTGHGGWGGGDEFNPKLNELYLNGEKLFSIVPWRTDCASYRFDNPASGNFNNGLSSSDLSRSNWCPATLTPPYLIPLDLAKGKHLLEVIIDQGAPEGNSHSAWSVTGVLVGEKKGQNGTLAVESFIKP